MIINYGIKRNKGMREKKWIKGIPKRLILSAL